MANAVKIGIGVWMVAGLCYVFLKLPAAFGFQNQEMARMVALHLPNAYCAVIAAFMSGWYGFRYLTKGRNPLDDSKSVVAASLALLFCVTTTATGSLFAQVQWGTWWNWDPRETSVFVLLLVYAAYFLLRAGLDDPQKRASASGVYIIFAAVLTPLLGYVIPKYMESLHPKDAQFDATYRMAIYFGILPGLLGMMIWLNNLGVRYERAALALREAEVD